MGRIGAYSTRRKNVEEFIMAQSLIQIYSYETPDSELSLCRCFHLFTKVYFPFQKRIQNIFWRSKHIGFIAWILLGPYNSIQIFFSWKDGIIGLGFIRSLLIYITKDKKISSPESFFNVIRGVLFYISPHLSEIFLTCV